MKKSVALFVVMIMFAGCSVSAYALTAKAYQEVIKKDPALKAAYLMGVTATAQVAASKTRLYCLPKNRYIDPDFTEGVIDAALKGLRKVGKYQSDFPIEVVFIEAMRAKYACPKEK